MSCGHIVDLDKGQCLACGELVNPSKPVRRLLCACCGAVTRGRQWYNRDTGHGLCSECVPWLRSRKDYDPEEFKNCYGVEGIHFNVAEGRS